MKYAKDFRAQAAAGLRGRWAKAIVASLLAALLGAMGEGGPRLDIDVAEDAASFSLELAGKQIFSTQEGLSQAIQAHWELILAAGILLALVILYVGSVVALGYARFRLDLVDRWEKISLGMLFAYFRCWKRAVATRLLRTLFVALWSLLLVIPGIFASYSYAMTDFVLAENPGLTAREAIARSKEMMRGNRFRLFCLQLSFIGWMILSALTLGIGDLWLNPYRQTAVAAFYREVSANY